MKYLPEPISFQLQGHYYKYDNTTLSTPYRNLDWQKTASEYGVKVPEIVDMTMGKSKCAGCGAVYTGYQPYCELQVIHYRRPNAYHPDRGGHSTYPIELAICKGDLKWDLMDQFNLQKEFFSLLDSIGNLGSIEYDPIYKFSSHFPRGVADTLKVRLLEQSMNQHILAVREALNQIATKMNTAGCALTFGF